MAYFEELPNISQPSLLFGSNRIEDRVIVKNLFKRSKLRTDVDQAITAFNYYYIEDNQRPDILAQELYGDSELDWVILTSNNICLLYTSPSPRDLSTSRMPSSA